MANGAVAGVAIQMGMRRARRTPRTGRLSLLAGLLSFLMGLSQLSAAAFAPPAAADPGSPQALVAEYEELGEEAARTTDDMHEAQSEYDRQREAVSAAEQASATAQDTLDSTAERLSVYQKRVDAVARASSRGARVNRLYAVLVSDSPQSLLDQMSGLEVLSKRVAADLAGLKDARQNAQEAKTTADRTAREATEAVAEAERVRGELQTKQADLAMQAVQIRTIYQSMTGRELAILRGTEVNFDPASVPAGTSPALVAVQAALSRIGDPYVWGATGPDSFDCSGLMVWAYQQAGKTLPRSSQAQLGGGSPVDRADLRPGDLVVYYPTAHHVAMYVGNGHVIHASTFGVPVKIDTLDGAGPYNAARRY